MKLICIEEGFNAKCSCGNEIKNPVINEEVTAIGFQSSHRYYDAFLLKEYGELPCGCFMLYRAACFKSPLVEELVQKKIAEAKS